MLLRKQPSNGNYVSHGWGHNSMSFCYGRRASFYYTHLQQKHDSKIFIKATIKPVKIYFSI